MSNNFARSRKYPSVSWIKLSVVFGICFLLAFSFAQSKSLDPRDAQRLLPLLRKKMEKQKTLKGHLDLVSQFSEDQQKSELLKGHGELYVAAPRRFRMDMVADLQGTPEHKATRVKSQIILDGKNLWFKVDNSEPGSSFLGHVDFRELVRKFPKVFSTGDGYYDPADELSELDWKSLKLLGKDSYEGKKRYILEGKLKSPIASLFPFGSKEKRESLKVKVWVGVEDGITYQSSMLDSNGKELGRMTLSKVLKNPTFNPNVFHFSPPKGVTPIDMTPMMEDELQSKNSVITP